MATGGKILPPIEDVLGNKRILPDCRKGSEGRGHGSKNTRRRKKKILTNLGGGRMWD